MMRGRADAMPRVYISGPITGVDPTRCREKFAAAEKHIRNLGGVPINPLMVAQMWPGLGYDDYINIDLALIDICDEIYVLRGFAASQGCGLEMAYAKRQGCRVRYQVDEERVVEA